MNTTGPPVARQLWPTLVGTASLTTPGATAAAAAADAAFIGRLNAAARAGYRDFLRTGPGEANHGRCCHLDAPHYILYRQ